MSDFTDNPKGIKIGDKLPGTTNTPFEEQVDEILTQFKYHMSWGDRAFLQRAHVQVWSHKITQLHKAAIVAELQSLIHLKEGESLSSGEVLERVIDRIDQHKKEGLQSSAPGA